MREMSFVQSRQNQWYEFEEVLAEPSKSNADRLADLYIHVTDDLAYAIAQYPHSKTTKYLNSLAARAHLAIYRRERGTLAAFKNFWVSDVPLAMYQIRYSIVAAAVLFVAAATMAFVACLVNPDTISDILGQSYVDYTIDNIKAGDPFGIYARESGFPMFLRIVMNNLWVGLNSVALGLVPVLGPAFSIMNNGFMLGSFHALFATNGIVADMFLAVYLHGAFEITAIVVCVGAAISIANGVLIPRTLPRGVAFRRNAMAAAKVYCGMVPFIIVAAIIESWVTRFYKMPYVLSLIIVLGTLGLILYYVFILPRQLVRRNLKASGVVKNER